MSISQKSLSSLLSLCQKFSQSVEMSRSKVFWGTPYAFGCALSRLGQSLARIKLRGGSTPNGAKCSLPRKIHLSGSILANKTFLFVDQSSPDFFHGTREESLSITFLSDIGYLEAFRKYSRSK